MKLENPDLPCGFCAGGGRRGIPRGVWLTGPPCPDCGGTGLLVTCPEAERLLGFVDRHLGHLLRLEIAALRAGVLGQAVPSPATMSGTTGLPEKSEGGRVHRDAAA